MTGSWYLVQAAQLVFLLEHLKALRCGVVQFSAWSGPGEALWATMAVLLMQPVLRLDLDPYAHLVYAGILLVALIYVARLPDIQLRHSLLICLFYFLVPSALIYRGVLQVTLPEILGSGLCLSVLTSDLIVAKMSGRGLQHPCMIFFAMVAKLDYVTATTVSVAYYMGLMWELSRALDVPLLTCRRNVLVLGVFDLFHHGHSNMMEEALKHGTGLIVGIHSDKDCTDYKRTPVMTLYERCAAVQACRYVQKVVPAAPLVLTKEFLEEHHIHVVALSVEYDSPEDPYYAVPRELGMTVVLPRTSGISTSELLQRALRQ